MQEKEALEKRIQKLLKLRVLFVILSSVFLGIAITCDIAVITIYLLKAEIPEIANMIIIEASSLFFAASIALFFVRIFAIDVKLRNAMFKVAQMNAPQQFVDLGTVDAKEKPAEPVMDQKHQLVKEYEDLMNRGYITEEEYIQKRKDILGE